jgi:Uma2 family endonuclease
MAISLNNPVIAAPPLPMSSLDDLPMEFEDDHEVEMGESNPHFVSDDILYNGIKAHLAGQPKYQVFSNMDMHYHPKSPASYKTPDVMVVTPFQPLPFDLTSYRIGEDGPAPVLATEVLSQRTAARGDLERKVTIYARLGIGEYLLVDPTGEFLPERLLLKRLRRDGTWEDCRDADGGVTSQLGFRVIFDADGRLRVLDAQSGRPYPRPDEAESEAEQKRQAEAGRQQAEAARQQAEAARQQAEAARDRDAAIRKSLEDRIRQLEAELERRRRNGSESQPSEQ